MKYRHINYSVIALAVAGVLSLLLLSTPAAQNASPAGTAAAPKKALLLSILVYGAGSE